MEYEDLRIVETPSLVRDYTLEKLRNAISTGLYPPGARLVERELCEALGVSRTSVREALRQLQSENLVEVSKRRNISVAVITSKDAEDIYLIREMLETMAIRRFVALADDAEVKQLVKIQKSFGKTASKSAPRQLAALAGELYNTILEGARSRVISEVARPLLARVNYLRAVSMSEPGRMEGGLVEWEAMVDAVVARDADKAAEAMAQHLRNARAAIVARLEADENQAEKVAS
ncbi:GntR family transcriptional regulator [Caulobacter sp. RHG1]|uniref:GntR family transcriptional regulator n=1 Tax=Caulobacter sp. (strain RHG1) TaxID=2545762 RepID=UPI00155390D8|nr:GntR family transcriptional regulator [Caulobacter sp. RHG1]NQE63641.1 Transcriptional regulator, GntR family [Caulobacter sp. RHG1]